ncbi:uncharacterized protein LOC133815837 [Humulus lupulus]|uniref:uncharacterized protein LOC133815837 n=1 Tax=Humulus lupulus TaxID=3486 RepID=UPI002B410F10|nr:uncharacterized protein LOC133815837 [Humulus lupulus]
MIPNLLLPLLLCLRAFLFLFCFCIMGSDKRHYDITMSRRTRRPFQVRDEKGISPKSEGEESDRKSLKQLIDGDEKAQAFSSDEPSRVKSSLGEHLVVEGEGEGEGQKLQLQIVGVQHQKEGMKLKKMSSLVSALRKKKHFQEPFFTTWENFTISNLVVKSDFRTKVDRSLYGKFSLKAEPLKQLSLSLSSLTCWSVHLLILKH